MNPLNAPTSDDKLYAGLGYVGLGCCAFIPAMIIFFLKKDESAHIKFHSLQAMAYFIAVLGFSLVFSIVLGVLNFIPVVGHLLSFALWAVFALASFGLWIYFILMAFTGKDIRIPYLADFIDANLMQ